MIDDQRVKFAIFVTTNAGSKPDPVCILAETFPSPESEFVN